MGYNGDMISDSEWLAGEDQFWNEMTEFCEECGIELIDGGCVDGLCYDCEEKSSEEKSEKKEN